MSGNHLVFKGYLTLFPQPPHTWFKGYSFIIFHEEWMPLSLYKFK